jgi:hypothetical protein
MNEFELRRHLRDLPHEREPSRDLWPEIAARIAADPPRESNPPRSRPSPSRRVPIALAAAAGLVAMLAAGLFRSDDALPTPDPLVADHVGVLREAAAMRFEYRIAIAQLSDTPLPPELRPAARELKQAEAMLRDALLENPDSTFLLGQLRRTYEQQLRLSQRAAFG